MRKNSFIVFGIIFALIAIILWYFWSSAMTLCHHSSLTLLQVYGDSSLSTYCIVKQSTYGAWAWMSMFLATGCFICAGIQGKAEKKEKAFRKYVIEKLNK